MDPLLLGTASAFGLAAASGLNTSLPLLMVGLAARFGLLSLGAPFDALESDIALIGLGILSIVEFSADKVPAADTVLHIIQGPVTLAAGAILFASQHSMIQEISPGLALLCGVLTAGGVHLLRAAARPVVNIGTLGLGAPVVSLFEDFCAIGLTVLSLLAPVLAIVSLLVVLVLAVPLVARRLTARRPALSP